MNYLRFTDHQFIIESMEKHADNQRQLFFLIPNIIIYPSYRLHLEWMFYIYFNKSQRGFLQMLPFFTEFKFIK